MLQVGALTVSMSQVRGWQCVRQSVCEVQGSGAVDLKQGMKQHRDLHQICDGLRQKDVTESGGGN